LQAIFVVHTEHISLITCYLAAELLLIQFGCGRAISIIVQFVEGNFPYLPSIAALRTISVRKFK
jgi:hypothetical protein